MKCRSAALPQLWNHQPCSRHSRGVSVARQRSRRAASLSWSPFRAVLPQPPISATNIHSVPYSAARRGLSYSSTAVACSSVKGLSYSRGGAAVSGANIERSPSLQWTRVPEGGFSTRVENSHIHTSPSTVTSLNSSTTQGPHGKLNSKNVV